MLEKFEAFNKRISGWGEAIGFGAVFFMVVLTCVDVLSTKLFDFPVFGSLDMMMLAQIIAVSFAAAMALISGRHVQVEFIMLLFPKRIQVWVDCVIQMLCLILFMLIVWRLFTHGYHLQIGGEQTATARIPMSPFSYAAALAIIPICLVFLQRFLSSILRAIRS